MRPKTCKQCGDKFIPERQMQACCSIPCAIDYGRMQSAKEDRKATKMKLEKLKPLSKWLKEAQIAFNAYIRERDKGKPCICCGLPLSSGDIGGAFDCGHYRSVGSAPHLRFDERNAHGQRKQCNRYGSGRAVDYRIGIIARLGQGAVDALESDQEPKKYTIEDAKRIKAEFVAKLKELKA